MNVHQRQEHFYPNKAQQHRQANLQIGEFVHHTFQHEKERTQAQNGKDIGEKDNILVLGNGENSRNGVKGENDIRKFDNQQHHKQRCEQPATVLLLKLSPLFQ